MTIHTLPSRLDTPAAEPLCKALRDRLAAGQPLLLDGAAVEQTGQACLQVIASARATAVARDIAFAIENPSAALLKSCAIAGLDASLSRTDRKVR